MRREIRGSRGASKTGNSDYHGKRGEKVRAC